MAPLGLGDGDGAAAFAAEEGDVAGGEEFVEAALVECAFGAAEFFGDVGGVFAGPGDVNGAAEGVDEFYVEGDELGRGA